MRTPRGKIPGFLYWGNTSYGIFINFKVGVGNSFTYIKALNGLGAAKSSDKLPG